MTTVFLLSDPLTVPVPWPGDWEAVEVVSLDEARERLEDERSPVVVFRVAEKQIPITVTEIQGINPHAACVAVVNERDDFFAESGNTDCLFLSNQAGGFQQQALLLAAARQAELLAALSDTAQTDEVTNLFNRRYFLARTDEEISLSRRHLSPLACVVISVRFFKMYVDSYGYDFISGLFRHMGEVVARHVRKEDIIARLGDDEIGILMPRSTERGARVLANRILLALNGATFGFGEYEEHITAFAGIAGYPMPDESEPGGEALIRYARHALHNAGFSDDAAIHVQLFSEIKPAL